MKMNNKIEPQDGEIWFLGKYLPSMNLRLTWRAKYKVDKS
jgi:hypothetical protein